MGMKEERSLTAKQSIELQKGQGIMQRMNVSSKMRNKMEGNTRTFLEWLKVLLRFYGTPISDPDEESRSLESPSQLENNF